MKFACPIKDCRNTLIGYIIPFCGEHWEQLSPEMREAVLKARKISLAAEKAAIAAAIQEIQYKEKEVK